MTGRSMKVRGMRGVESRDRRATDLIEGGNGDGEGE